MKIIMPIAGRGSRFQNESDSNPEYKRAKPLIRIKGKPMVLWALESLPFIDLPHRAATTSIVVKPEDLIFIALEEHESQYGIISLLKEQLTDKIHVVLIPEVTRGALETVLKAKSYLNHDEDVLITDCDHYFRGNNLYKAILEKDENTMGIIPVFRPPDDEVKWSYTLFDENFRASAVAEKDAMLASQGAYANIGAYYFSKSGMFIDEATQMIESGSMYGPKGKQEFYVAPLYQRLIDKGNAIHVSIIPKVWGLGTPKDLSFFLTDYKS